MNTLSIHRPFPSMETCAPQVCTASTNSALVNWTP